MTCEPPVGIILHDSCALAGAQKFLGAAGRCPSALVAVEGLASCPPERQFS